MMYTCFVAALILSTFANAYHPSELEQHQNYRNLPLDECGESMSDRIVGGTQARLGQYPWLARVGYSLTNCPESQMKPTFKCGGSLIAQMYVISAAHCVATNPTQLCKTTGHNETLMLTHIILGEHVVEQEIDCENGVCSDPTQNFGVVDIVYHASYNKPALKFDVALIKLHKPATFTGWVSPICMPVGPILTSNFIGQTAEVAGWGIMDVERQTTSKVLLFVHVPIIEVEYCKKEYIKYATLTDAETCAGGVTGEDSCGGDSGGPLMVISSLLGRPRYYLLGVVSFGATKCGAADTPAVYTNVPFYMKWILDNMEN